MRKVTPRPEHKERSQPAHRKRFGLLEKHKDYVVRAKNYHFKEKRLQALKEKAEFRNPDEFYFKMLNSKTKNGVHKANKNNGPLAETVKILKTQDLGYVTMKATAEVKKVDKLSQNLHFVGMQKPKSHIVFVDDEEEAEQFDAAAHFDTEPELVDRHFNRPRKDVLAGQKIISHQPLKRDLNRVEKEKAKSYLELNERLDREGQLKTWMRDMEMNAQIMGKGKKKKMKSAKGGRPAVFKWDTARKK